MGKTRRSKDRPNNDNPLGLPSINSMLMQEELNGIEETTVGPITAIVEQLQSVSVEEKMCALQTLATLCQNHQKINGIIESDIVRIAGPLLMDPNINIRNATAGALRNLSVCGLEVCENLVEKDILTPLLALLNEYSTVVDWVPTFDNNSMDELDVRSDTFLQAVNVVWNLCESTPVAVESFNEAHLLQSFIRGLNYTVFGCDIAIAVAQCLIVISEDNPSSWKVLCNYGQEFSSLLVLEENHSQVLLRSLSAGIMANVPALAEPYMNQILISLSKTLDIQHRSVLAKITSSLPLTEETNSHEIEITDDSAMDEEATEAASKRRRRDDLPTEIEKETKRVGWLLEAQRVSAETLTNICSSDDDEWENEMEDDDEESDEEEVHDYDKSNHSSSNNLQNTDKLSVEILEAIKSLGIVEKLWQRAQPVAENVVLILKDTERSLLKKLNSMQVSSILCLHNLCNTMSKEDLGGPEAIYRVWLDLGQQVFQGPQDISHLEATTSLMRAALDHLKTNKELFSEMTDNDLVLMLDGVKNCTESEIRANWLRMLGILGCILPENLVRVIITFILETCSKEIDVWTISEALDSLMDMFSDNDWNQIAFELNISQKTKELERIVKNKLKQQKRDLGERYAAVSTVRNNLSRFSKYIETQQKLYKP